MPVIPFFVDQGNYAITQPGTTLFGTDGVGTCFGIVADLGGGNVFCGHLDNGIAATPANLQTITTNTQARLTTALQGQTVNSFHVTTTNGDQREVGAVTQGINNFLGGLQNQINATWYSSMGIAWNNGNVQAGNNYQNPGNVNQLTNQQGNFTI